MFHTAQGGVSRHEGEFYDHKLQVKGKNVVRFEVITVVAMKNGVFWDVTPCGSCKNRRSGGT
jgi:hypothetical protein